MQGRTMRRALLPTTGVVAAVAAAVSGWAPIAQSSPSQPAQKAEPLRQQPAADSADGTYESCGAYFGFGKDTDGVLDVVEFDVADQNGDDGVAHAVPDDTEVVLELTNEDGDVIECAAVEVSETDWEEAMGDIDLFIPEGGTPLPGWPGPGHYAYPSVPYEPTIEDFGTVVDVGFKVVRIPDGHTLVSPTGLVPLVQHQVFPKFQFDYTPDPRVLDLIETDAGTPAREAFVAAMEACEAETQDAYSADQVDAINALLAYRGLEPRAAEDMSCFDDVGMLNHDVSFLLGLYETVTYAEPIVLALPEEPTTTTTSTTPQSSTSTTQPTVTQPSGATPLPGSPSYTG